MKRISVFLVLLIILFGSIFLIPERASAGSINGAEASIIAAASGTFTYNGSSYVSSASAMASLREYLSRDDVDLTADQADRAISIMYANIRGGVKAGYLIYAGKGKDPNFSEPEKEPKETKGSTSKELTYPGYKEWDSDSERPASSAKLVASSEYRLEAVNSDGLTVFADIGPVKNTGYSLNNLMVLALLMGAVFIGCLVAIVRLGLWKRGESA